MLIKFVIDNLLDTEKRDRIISQIEDYMKDFKGRLDVMKVSELKKIKYSSEFGFNVFEINPSNCDTNVCNKQLKTLFVKTVSIIRKILGHELTLNYFSQSNLFNYVFKNSELLRKLDLANFFLQLFLIN